MVLFTLSLSTAAATENLRMQNLYYSLRRRLWFISISMRIAAIRVIRSQMKAATGNDLHSLFVANIRSSWTKQRKIAEKSVHISMMKNDKRAALKSDCEGRIFDWKMD